jgi:hypothetical protein
MSKGTKEDAVKRKEYKRFRKKCVKLTNIMKGL